MRYTVHASGITKSFGGRPVLHHVDLVVPDGSVSALLGPNGAGKTTLVRILATLVCPDEGTATIAGHDLLTDAIGVRRSISLTGQFAAIDDLLTGEENLELMARLRHLSKKAARTRATELLADFDLMDSRHQRAGSYSGGMKRRLDLAMGMIERPLLLFLDEPTTGLDPRSREQLWDTVRRLVADGVTILLTTQYLEEADQLADSITLLDQGRVVAQGGAQDLKQRVGSEVIRLEFANVAVFERAQASLSSVRSDSSRCTLDVATDGTAGHLYETLGRLVRSGVPATTVALHRPSLSDVFLSLTGARHSAAKSKEVA
jgi:ABC-2 type transport system ATP-binding protein